MFYVPGAQNKEKMCWLRIKKEKEKIKCWSRVMLTDLPNIIHQESLLSFILFIYFLNL